jgi:hypothetical protein
MQIIHENGVYDTPNGLDDIQPISEGIRDMSEE